MLLQPLTLLVVSVFKCKVRRTRDCVTDIKVNGGRRPTQGQGTAKYVDIPYSVPGYCTAGPR